MGKRSQFLQRTAAISVGAANLVLATAAYADAQAPAISGNGWIGIAVIAVAVLIIMLFISGAINFQHRDDTSDEEDQGVGVFEGIEEDDEKPKKKKK